MFEEHKNRREFLKQSIAGAAAMLSGTALAQIANAETAGVGTVKVWSTSAAGKMVPKVIPNWHKTSSGNIGNYVLVAPEKRSQTILGFGGAFTDAACYTFNGMPKDQRESLFNELFSPSGLGLNVCRTCIGSSDYSTKAYTFDDGEPDPDLTRFSISHDEEYILPILREARKVNPDLFLFSSPWTPPAWMKSNNSLLGGNMRRKYMPAYANYFVKFLKGYESAGVPIQAVTIQNEVDTDQDGNMPQCTWPQEYEADFVRNNLGPAFEKDGIKTKIWLIDHNYNLWGRAVSELETENVKKYASGIAWHGYVGDPAWMTRVHNADPTIEMFWTEGGPDYTDKKYLTDWSKWGTAFSGILRNWCRSITAWNLALDESGKPNIGPFPCGGVVTIDSKSNAITRSGQYWALAHFSKFVHRDAVRISSELPVHRDVKSGATPEDHSIDHVAFENPNKERVLVLTNPGEARQVRIMQVAGSVTEIQLDADSITTVVWS